VQYLLLFYYNFSLNHQTCQAYFMSHCGRYDFCQMVHNFSNSFGIEHLLFNLVFVLTSNASHICLTYISAIMLQHSLKLIFRFLIVQYYMKMHSANLRYSKQKGNIYDARHIKQHLIPMVMQVWLEVMRSEYNIAFGKFGDERPLGRCKFRWKDNTKVNLKKVKWQNVKLV
jgi:hypothetical protein